MGNGITSKGKAWEWSKTWWLIGLTIFFFGWIPFVYMGAKTKTKKWLIEGIIYCAILHVTVAFSEGNKSVYNTLIVFMMLAWIVSIIRIFMVRKEYLLRREAMESMEMVSDANLKRQIQNEYRTNAYSNSVNNTPVQRAQPIQNYTTTSTNDVPKTQTSQNTVGGSKIDLKRMVKKPQMQASTPSLVTSPISSGQPIDVNTCDESTLAALPGVSVAMAKKAVFHREEVGGFESIGDFCDYLELKPHIISQLDGKITCSSNSGSTARQSGRILDI